jgi:hypothetical protein
MPKYVTGIERRSRREKVEAKRYTKQTVWIGILFFIMLFFLVRFGGQAFVNTALFIGNLRQTVDAPQGLDTIPPSPPQLSLPFTATNSATISFNGYTESGAVVGLFVNGAKVDETLANDQGSFDFRNVGLNQGSNTLYAIAQDQAGNQSNPSTKTDIIYSNQPPELVIDHPLDGQKFFGQLEQSINITGVTDETAQVYINERIAIVSSNGAFSSRIQLKEGENTITITAQNPSGNQAQKSLTVLYYP